MTTRTESIPLPDLSLKEGETVSDAEYRDGEVVFTIVTEDDKARTEAGKKFLEASRKIAETPINDGFWDSDDPRIRAILDR